MHPRNYVAALDSRIISPLLAVGASRTALLRHPANTVRTWACIILGFLFMLRPSSIIRVRVQDLRFFHNPGVFRFTVAWEKTRLVMEPRSVHVPFSYLAPPPWLSLVHLAVADAQDAGDTMLFPPSAAHPDSLWFADDTATDSAAANEQLRETVKHQLTVAVRKLAADALREWPDLPPLTEFSCRSLRAGGATAAAMLGYSSRDIERVGNWQSSETVGRYVRQALAAPDAAVAAAFKSVFNFSRNFVGNNG